MHDGQRHRTLFEGCYWNSVLYPNCLTPFYWWVPLWLYVYCWLFWKNEPIYPTRTKCLLSIVDILDSSWYTHGVCLSLLLAPPHLSIGGCSTLAGDKWIHQFVCRLFQVLTNPLVFDWIQSNYFSDKDCLKDLNLTDRIGGYVLIILLRFLKKYFQERQMLCDYCEMTK